MSSASEEAAQLRHRLRPFAAAVRTEASEERAGVLVLLSRRAGDEDYSVLLCVRSLSLRRHPGEVCFPGGMRDKDEDLVDTALREAHEEVGLESSQVEVLATLPAFRARYGILIYPTVALLKEDFEPRLSEHEVAAVFWKPLSSFLVAETHDAFVIDGRYSVHSFAFPDHHVFGVTAFMCLVVAVALLDRRPDFDLTLEMNLPRMASLSPSQIVGEVFHKASAPFQSKL